MASTAFSSGPDIAVPSSEAGELKSLQEEIARLLAETTSSDEAAAVAESALKLQIETALKREKNATSDCASRVADLTTTLVGRELSAVSAATSSTSGDLGLGRNAFVPLEGKAALADSYNKLQAETARLRDEENERQARIAAMEQALRASEGRIQGHEKRFQALLQNLKSLQEALQKKEAQERSTLQALEAERNDARRVIGEHSDKYAQRLVSVWDQEGASAASSVATEFEPELLAIASQAESELAESTTLVRSIARQLAGYLSSLSNANELLSFSENGGQLPPHSPHGSANDRYLQQFEAIARLESQRANHAKVAPRLMAIRAQCLNVLEDLRQGKGGVSKMMLKMVAGEPEEGGTEADFRPLIAPFPLMSEALVNASPSAGLSSLSSSSGGRQGGLQAFGAGLVAPPHDVYAKLEQQDASSLGMQPVEARLEVARLTEKVITRLMAVAEINSATPSFEDDQNSEPGNDQLALYARAEPHEAANGTAGSSDNGEEEGLRLITDALRDSQQAVTAVSRPPLPIGANAGGSNALTPRRRGGSPTHQHHDNNSSNFGLITKGDLGAQYRLEAERLEAREKIHQAETALADLLREKSHAESALLSSRSKRESSADVQQALEATRYQLSKGSKDIEILRDWLSQALQAYRAKFGSHYHHQDGSDGHFVEDSGDGSSGGSAATLRSLLGYGSTAGADGSTGGSAASNGRPGEDEPPLVATPKVVLSLKSPTVVLPSPTAPAPAPSTTASAAEETAPVAQASGSTRSSVVTAAGGSSSASSIQRELMASLLVKPAAVSTTALGSKQGSKGNSPTSAAAGASVSVLTSPPPPPRASARASLNGQADAAGTTVGALLRSGSGSVARQGRSGTGSVAGSVAGSVTSAKAPDRRKARESSGQRSEASAAQPLPSAQRSAFGISGGASAVGAPVGGDATEDLIGVMANSARSGTMRSRSPSISASVLLSPQMGGAGGGGGLSPVSPAVGSANSLRRNTRIRAGSLIGPRGGRLYTPSAGELHAEGGQQQVSPRGDGGSGSSSSRRGSVVASPAAVAAPSPRLSVSPRGASAGPRPSISPRGMARPSMGGATLADLLRGAL
jgi:hypothetical protein